MNDWSFVPFVAIWAAAMLWLLREYRRVRQTREALLEAYDQIEARAQLLDRELAMQRRRREALYIEPPVA